MRQGENGSPGLGRLSYLLVEDSATHTCQCGTHRTSSKQLKFECRRRIYVGCHFTGCQHSLCAFVSEIERDLVQMEIFCPKPEVDGDALYCTEATVKPLVVRRKNLVEFVYFFSAFVRPL